MISIKTTKQRKLIFIEQLLNSIQVRRYFNSGLHALPCASALAIVSIIAAQPAVGQVVSDPLASVEFRPHVGASENGTPVVDITAPSYGNVSHNKFKEYNIDTRGIILNNAVISGTSILGGEVQANQNLVGKRSAHTILNEVTGPSQSKLDGVTEVFGHKADVIVANPNGIECNGCNFINVGKATLTTGVPHLNYETGDATFEVREGTVSIHGDGISVIPGQAPLNGINLAGRHVNIDSLIVTEGPLLAVGGVMSYDSGSESATALEVGMAKPTAEPTVYVSPKSKIYAENTNLQSKEKGRLISLRGSMFHHSRFKIDNESPSARATLSTVEDAVSQDTKAHKGEL